MIRLASILRLVRVAAAIAAILVFGLSLPSAAHSVSDHHNTETMLMTGASLKDAPHTSHHGKEGSKTLPSETVNCCAGACVAMDVLSLQPCHDFVQFEVRWVVADAKLPSLDLITRLRPPKS